MSNEAQVKGKAGGQFTWFKIFPFITITFTITIIIHFLLKCFVIFMSKRIDHQNIILKRNKKFKTNCPNRDMIYIQLIEM